jgi:hypothetical protein
VQEFYDWYGRPDRDRYDEDVLKSRPEVLDESLYRLLKADRECISKSKGICNLDFDPFYNSQDPAPKYLATRVRFAGELCLVSISEARDGKPQGVTRVQPEMKWVTNHWVFVNFDYFYPDDPAMKPTDLRTILMASPE